MIKSLIYRGYQIFVVLIFYFYLFGFFLQKRNKLFSIKRYSKFLSFVSNNFIYKIIKRFIKVVKIFGRKLFEIFNFGFKIIFFNFLFKYFYCKKFILHQNVCSYLSLLFFLFKKVYLILIFGFIKSFVVARKKKKKKKSVLLKIFSEFIKNRNWLTTLIIEKNLFKLLNIQRIFLYYITISILFLVLYYKYLTVIALFMLPYFRRIFINKVLVYFNLLFFWYCIISFLYMLNGKFLILPLFSKTTSLYIGNINKNNNNLFLKNKI